MSARRNDRTDETTANNEMNGTTSPPPRKTKAEKRGLGSYYTPSALHEALCDWAIRSSEERILEPSFGGCGFLESAREKLLSIGNQVPDQNMYGCDIDKDAFAYLTEKIATINISKRFLHADFMTLQPSDFAVSEFDVVVGNPPYISHHNMTKAQKTAAKAVLKNTDFGCCETASLWVYFVLHALKFLKRGGRVAWVLPQSLLFAAYSSSIKRILAERFSRVLFLPIDKHLFLSEGTEERTVILVAEGWQEGPSARGIEIKQAANSEGVKNVLQEWAGQACAFQKLNGRSSFYQLSKPTAELFDRLVANKDDYQIIRLGDLMDIRIGIVTGNNKFFVIDQESADKNRLTNGSLRPVLPKFHLTKGLVFKDSDFLGAKKDNQRCILLNPIEKESHDDTVKAYLNSYVKEKRESNGTFKKRAVWFLPDDGIIPDAFFPYMHHNGPRLVLNQAKIQCTNTIHRIFFKKGVSQYLRKAIAISLLSSFSQLSAEIEGRSYGSGVLKHEPSEVKRISIILPKDLDRKMVGKLFSDIDTVLRAGLISKAKRVADDFVLSEVSKITHKELQIMFDEAILIMRAKRLGRDHIVS
jgi:adenine-specific DNA methylase